MPCRFFNILSLFWNIFLDAIFPWHCCFCKQEIRHYPLCQDCQKNIVINHSFICPSCKKRIINLSKNCCSKNSFIYALGFVSSYENPILKETIHFFKYQRIIALQKPLANLMVKFLKETKLISGLNQKNILLIPVPLHSKKQKERGFNQSELLAKNLSIYFGLALDSKILLRVKNNLSQVKIQNFIERKRNVKNVFQIPKEKINLIRNKWIILIDDVYTSGATMQEAAKVLKQNGAKKVIGLVLAKG